jgi:hypothetical protein
MATKYQVTELDRALQQAKQEFPELEEPNHYKMGNDLLMRDIKVLKTQLKKAKDLISKLQIKASSKSMAHICMQDDADRYYIQLDQYRNLKSECHKDIEKVWMYDSSYGLDDNQTIDRDACIERVFYKIANQWID